MSQRELAARIGTTEPGIKTMPQRYLNDIEQGLREPQKNYLVGAFARALDLEKDYLLFLLGRLDEEIPTLCPDRATINRSLQHLRGSLRAWKRPVDWKPPYGV